MSHCPHTQDPEISVAVLSPEIILLGFRHFRGRDWGKGGDQQNTRSPGTMAKELVCGTRDAQSREQQSCQGHIPINQRLLCRRAPDGRAGVTYTVSL